MINIQDLYYAISVDDKKLNPFETEESDRLYCEVYDKYILSNEDEQFNGDSALLEFMTNERRTAFEIGFKTAMHLIFEGLSSAPKETHKAIKEYGKKESTPQVADMPL